MLPGFSGHMLMASGPSGPSDPFFDSVSCLLHFDGPNNGTVFTDSSNNALPITLAGNAKIDTSQSMFGGASATFDGTGDYAYSDHATAFDLTGDYTVEFFLRRRALISGNWGFVSMNASGKNAAPDFGIQSDKVLVYLAGAQRLATSSSLALNTWYHLALTRAGAVNRLFLNGALQQSYSLATSWTDGGLTLGALSSARTTNATNKLNGWLDEFRVTQGVARYTASFTVPTEAFPDQ
ncbi:LamG-like jellyroll fold domain-containing protein [Kaistia adipata]|uniref:LamG-like jellyroll fold domain-containing protein n=1 Tax=Kaistia adipata TaxID=166954 RepID=UPI000491C449|nr:LamG-like jellyroll fold domain-containing protein [Kaistia adipata]